VFATESYLARFGEPLVPEDLSEASGPGPSHDTATATATGGDSMTATGERDFEVKPVVVANDPEMLLPLLARIRA
jgi:hypothetical protein